VDSDSGDAMASMPQPRNRLEDKGGKDDEVSRGVWEAMETCADEVRMVEAKREGGQRRSGKKIEREGEEEATEENSRSEKSSKRMGNLEQGGGSHKIRGRSKETGLQEISSVD